MTNEIACISALAWKDIAVRLGQEGYVALSGLPGKTQARTFSQLLHARSAECRIPFSSGEHGPGDLFYFTYPLPEPLEEWRNEYYKYLVPIANRWNEFLNVDYR